MDSPGRPPVRIELGQAGSESKLKEEPFKIKEGVKFTMSAEFKVQHEILSGLHYVQVIKRKGIKVSKDSEMIVSGTCRASCWSLRDQGANDRFREVMLPTPRTSPPTSRDVSIPPSREI